MGEGQQQLPSLLVLVLDAKEADLVHRGQLGNQHHQQAAQVDHERLKVVVGKVGADEEEEDGEGGEELAGRGELLPVGAGMWGCGDVGAEAGAGAGAGR